eukprot:6800437-Prymnesium_polylepis.1
MLPLSHAQHDPASHHNRPTARPTPHKHPNCKPCTQPPASVIWHPNPRTRVGSQALLGARGTTRRRDSNRSPFAAARAADSPGRGILAVAPQFAHVLLFATAVVYAKEIAIITGQATAALCRALPFSPAPRPAP